MDPHVECHPDRPAGAPKASLLDRALDNVARLCTLVAGVALVVLIAIFGWLVYGRYVANDTPTWVEQLALLLVAYITFLGAAVGIRRDTHLSVDFLREAMPPLPRFALRVLAELLVLAFGGFMAWQGWGLVETNLSRAIPMIGVSESWRAFALVAGGALVVVFSGARLADLLRPSR